MMKDISKTSNTEKLSTSSDDGDGDMEARHQGDKYHPHTTGDEEENNMDDFIILFDPNDSAAIAKLPSTDSQTSVVANTQRRESDCSETSLHATGRKRELSAIHAVKQMPKRSKQSKDGLVSGLSPHDPKSETLATTLRMSTSPITSGETSSSVMCPMSSQTSSDSKIWTKKSVQQILDSQTNPIGKFLRDLGVSAADVIQLNIMPHLDEAPRKPRTVYGKRKDLPPMDRKALNRERNREHAKSTRKRRKIFETVLDQQLRKLGQVICSSFTEEQTNRYLIRRSRRVENLVGFFLLMNSDISSDIPVNWQCCLSRHVNVFVQTQGVLEVEHQGQACYAASNGVLHLNPFSDIAQQQHRGSQSSPVCINGPSYSQVQDSVLSHGIVGHHLSRVSLVSNLTPQHTAATSSTLSCEQSDAFLGLPLCLLKFPVSPDAGHMKLQQTPVRNIYKGFEALGQATKMILRALQEAVYHVLLTHSFYRKIFDLLVPGTTSCDVSSIDLVNAWTKGSTTPLNEKHQQCLHDGTPLVPESGHSSSVDFNIDHSCQTPAPAARNLLFTKFTEEKEKTEQRLKIQEDHSTYNLEMSGGFNCDSVMSRGGMLCYPSSLTSPCGIHESLGRDVVGGIDNCSGSGESDSMRTCNKGNFDCDGGTGHRTPLISKSHDSPASSNKEFEFTMASSLASESPNQKSYMLHHPPTFSLEHLIPVNVKFLISNSKNDLLVQGTEAMCSFDVEVETKLHTEKQEGKGNSVSLNHESPTKVSNEGNMDDKGNDSTKHAINDKLHGARTDKTLVNVPGALASFVFDSDVGGGSKIVECNFDLDINAVALRYLDSSTLLRNYFGRISKDSERSDFVAATTV